MATTPAYGAIATTPAQVAQNKANLAQGVAAVKAGGVDAAQAFYGGGSATPTQLSSGNASLKEAGITPVTQSPATGPVAPKNPIATDTPNGSNAGQPTTNPVTPEVTRQQAIDNLQANGNANPDEDAIRGAINNLAPNQNTPALNKYQVGLSQASKSGEAAPQTGGAATGPVNDYLPVAQPEQGQTPADVFTQTDPYLGSIVKQWQDYMSPQNQRASLTDEYKKLTKDAGIETLNTDLINMKNVIDGSEDDIRNEITKAGGFATESQIQALTSSRNKQLVKNYNTLLETRNSKQDYVNTMINLTEKDRSEADSRFDKNMNFSMQLLTYRDKMQDNARSSYQKIIDNVGYKGLLGMTDGSPYYQNMVETTLGLGKGGLTKLAGMKVNGDTQIVELDNGKTVVVDKNTGDIIKDLGGSKGINTPTIKSINGKDLQWNATTGTWDNPSMGGATGDSSKLSLAQAQGNVDTISKLVTDPTIRTAVGPTGFARLIGRGFDTATGGRQNFISSVEQIRSNLNLDTLINAKARGATFGALSDNELQTLASSATKIGTWAIKDKNGNITGYNASEKDFKAELDKINNFSKLDYILKGGDPMDVHAQLMPDGTVWTKNNDGTFTQLK